jgi:hypothetical protein
MWSIELYCCILKLLIFAHNVVESRLEYVEMMHATQNKVWNFLLRYRNSLPLVALRNHEDGDHASEHCKMLTVNIVSFPVMLYLINFTSMSGVSVVLE